MAKRLDPDNTYTLYVNENDGKEVGILVDSNVPVTLDVKANPALSMEASFFGYFGEFLERGEEFSASDASGGVIDASQASDAALIQGDGTANTMYGGQGNDTMFGLAGDDVLSGGAGADYIDGGSGDDTIDGGADLDISNNQGDFTPPVWETGDRVRFQGDQENYTVTANADGTFSVEDTVGNGGTDTLRNIEILEFNDTEVLLAPETGSWSYTEYDPETGREKLVSEDFAEGTGFDDTIVGGDGRSFLRGGDGNDVLIGDSMSSNGDFASGQDMIDGGKGNDYIDGGGQGAGSQPWEKENAAEYFDEFNMLFSEKSPIAAKEARLVAIAVSAAIRCEYCIAAQIEFAKKEGANDEEIKAAIQIAAEIQRFSTLLYGNEFDVETFNKIIGRENK